MKKAKSARRRAPAKRSPASKTVAGYFAKLPPARRRTLRKLQAAILSAAPRGATGTISYGIPAVKYHGILVWYAAFAEHCSLFPTGSVIAAFRQDLKNYPISKGTVKFPADKPLPIPLIKKMVKARVAEIEKKKKR